jgi:hypothetical protein
MHSNQVSFRNRRLLVGSGSRFGTSILLQTEAPCPEIQGVSDLFVSVVGSESLSVKLILTGSFACTNCILFLFSAAASSRAFDVAALFLYLCKLVYCADSVPRAVSPSMSLPPSHLLDSSSTNSASRWWSAIVPIPPATAGSIVRLRFQCPGFQAPGDSLKVYDQGDTLTSSVICNPCSSATLVTTCVVQGPSKVCVCALSDAQIAARDMAI